MKMNKKNNIIPPRPNYTHYDLIVIGAGLVGLATAREFLRRYPDMRVAVLEKEAEIATHQSGNNSGVLHSGLYYTPGSLKARACVTGYHRMVGYCLEKGIDYELCGKVIVALDESELAPLEALYKRGIENGVQGLEMIGRERLKELEPHAAGIKAVYSPSTGVVDFKQVAKAYAEDIQTAGGEVITGTEVRNIITRNTKSIITLYSPSTSVETELEARFVISCAGLQSDRLAAMSGGTNDIKIVPFRGDYYVLRPEKRHLCRTLIYPVPDPKFPFLGVHFTKRIDNEVWAGPNAVLAFAREGYKRSHIQPKELWESVSFRGFQKLALKHWKTGLGEMYRDYRKSAFVAALQRYVPELKSDDLLPGPSGVRAQALDRDGKLMDDFVIQHGHNVVHVQNAPSPAATSSLVIAVMIVDKAQQNFSLPNPVKAF
jgi:L-2-hydroxyglutarate oxidase LhgO